MRYIAAYLLLQIAGVAKPDAAAIRKVLDAAGIETDDERLDKLISELADKDVNQVSVDDQIIL
jgi:large subunit ribosomal protein LP2